VAAFASFHHPNQGRAQSVVALADVPEGDSYLFRYPTSSDPAIVVHLAGGELHAYSQKCTHLGCVVYWQPDRGELLCPCHDGSFDPRTGEPIAGPPDRPLAAIGLDVRGGTIVATGVRT
jgi:Rieske Fe-S protein